MNYNEALFKNILLNELSSVPNLQPKAMTEKILLSIHYRHAVNDWLNIRESIDKESEASEDVKASAISIKSMEDCGIEDRRMSTVAFEQVVEAVLKHEAMPSILANQANANECKPSQITSAVWLQTFAEVLVEG